MLQMQVYLTETERNGLASLAHERGRKQTELVREAVDLLLSQQSAPQQFVPQADSEQRAILNRLAGMWQNRVDLPDFGALRGEWDRNRDCYNAEFSR